MMAIESAAYLDVLFDGPPSHEAGRFVECESPAGTGVKAGEWIDRGDGYWALRIDIAAIRAEARRAAIEECAKLCEDEWRVSTVLAEDVVRTDPKADPSMLHAHAAGITTIWHKISALLTSEAAK
jgi:hypothetical protein